MNMSSKTKKMDEPQKDSKRSLTKDSHKSKSNSSVQKKKAAADTSSSDVVASSEKKPEAAQSVSRPTRNCGCNTLISGNFDENSQAEQNDAPANCCGPACSLGSCPSPGSGAGTCAVCCNRPHCSYYYNPYTGCYYWCNNCCCCGCNSCCNSCCNACPMPAQQSNSKAGTPTSPKPNSPTGSPKRSKANSDSEQRIMAGAMAPFQPEFQDLYERWVGFQQYASCYPPIPPMPAMPATTQGHPGAAYQQVPRFPYPYNLQQPQQRGRSFSSPPPAGQRRHATDIDWTPH